MYHNGDDSIPPVFLIQNSTVVTEWEENFKEIETYLNHKSKVEIVTPVLSFPWSEK